MTVGDDLLRVAERVGGANAYGTVTTEMFVEHAERIAEQPLDQLFDRWLFQTELPDLPESPA